MQKSLQRLPQTRSTYCFAAYTLSAVTPWISFECVDIMCRLCTVHMWSLLKALSGSTADVCFLFLDITALAYCSATGKCSLSRSPARFVFTASDNLRHHRPLPKQQKHEAACVLMCSNVLDQGRANLLTQGPY